MAGLTTHNWPTLQPKLLYRHLNHMPAPSDIPIVVYLGPLTATGPIEKVSLFNEFFNSIYTKCTFELPPLHQMLTPSSQLWHIDIFISNVFNALSHLDCNKAVGHDRLNARMLKLCSYSIITPVTILFRHSVLWSLPWRMEDSQNIPIIQSGDKTNVENYRPISLLSILKWFLLFAPLCVNTSSAFYQVDQQYLNSCSPFTRFYPTVTKENPPIPFISTSKRPLTQYLSFYFTI